jgi:hypothetical protein
MSNTTTCTIATTTPGITLQTQGEKFVGQAPSGTATVTFSGKAKQEGKEIWLEVDAFSAKDEKGNAVLFSDMRVEKYDICATGPQGGLCVPKSMVFSIVSNSCKK